MPQGHTLSFPWAMSLGVTHRGERRLKLPPAILRLGKDTKVTTCFSDMSVAVNRTEGASLIWKGGPWSILGGENSYSASFQAQEQRVMEAGQPLGQCATPRTGR